jgi:hypothetical protein
MIESLRKLTEEQKKVGDATETARYFIKQYNGDLANIKDALKGASDATLVLSEVNKLLIEDQKKKDGLIRNEKNLTEEINNLRDEATLAIGNERAAINLKIKALEKEIETLKKLGEAIVGVSASSQKFAFDRMQGQPLVPPTGMTMEGASVTTDYADAIRKMGQKQVEESRAADNPSRADLNKQIDEVASHLIDMGNAMGLVFGEAIAGAQSFADSMKRASIQILDMVQEMMIKQLGSSLGPIGQLLVGLGFGVAKSLIANADSLGAKGVRSPSMRAYETYGTGRLDFYAQGSTMKATVANTNRTSSRTGN